MELAAITGDAVNAEAMPQQTQTINTATVDAVAQRLQGASIDPLDRGWVLAGTHEVAAAKSQ